MAVYADNSKAKFDYQILETFEAGIVLAGHEVKAVKKGHASLRGSYVKIIGGKPVLLGANISPYQPGNVSADYDPQRTRYLLLNKKEIKYLLGKAAEAGATLVPLKLYGKHNLIKLEIGLARGKKKYDKREAIKKQEVEKKIAQDIKNRLKS